MDKELTRPVGMIPSGLFIAGAVDGDTPVGFLASWVQQTSFTPLIVSLAVASDKPILGIIENSEKFTLNILAKNNSEIMKNFWKPAPDGKSQFDGLPFELGEYGPLLTSSIAAIECQLIESSKPGDHTLLFGKVMNTHLYHGEESPTVHIRKYGDGY